MKKIQLFLLLCFCVLAAHAQTFFNFDGIRYMIEDDHAVIARQDRELTGDIVIPATVTYEETEYPVTRLMSPDESESGGEGAFQGSAITSISLPASITEIPPFAFYRCNSLSSVTISQNVITIGYLAFAECSSLSSVTISKNVTFINNGAFEWCSNLSSFNVAEENLYFSSENGILFDKNKTTLLQYPQGKSETSYVIPNRVKSIGYYAFSGCKNLTSVTIPNSVTSIGGSAFSDCSGLTSVTIPNSVHSIDGGAFQGCSGLTSPVYNATLFAYMPTVYNGVYNIPEGIKEICGSAFSGCSGLTTINIPNSVTGIGSNAFEGCSGLTSITIPNFVTSIGGSTFSGCSGLTTINIPNSVTGIGSNAFEGCSGLTSITIPNFVTSIGGSTFSGCSGLTKIIIGRNVNNIEGNVFSGCQNLSEVWCYATVVPTVESDAFAESNYTNATLYVRETLLNEYENIEIWNSFKEIKNISSLQDYAPYHTIFVAADGIRYMTEDDDVVIARQDKELTGNITIPATVTYGEKEYNVTRLMNPGDGESGGGGAFQECEITGITLPEGITEIPNNTFSQCKQLSSVAIQGAVWRIGEYAFNGCEALTTIDLPDDVTEMGWYAFQNTGLTEFRIPAGVTVLNGYVLADTKITYLEIPVTVNRLDCLCFATNKTDEQGQPLKRTVKMFQRDCRLINDDEGMPDKGTEFGDMTTVDLLVPAGSKALYQEYFPWMNMNSITEYGEDMGDALVLDQRHITFDGIRYMLKNGEAYVDIQPETLSGEVVIPDKVTYEGTDYPVTKVMGSYWAGNMNYDGLNAYHYYHFSGAFTQTQVTKVTLPAGIKSIGHNAFDSSQQLQEVVLNEGINEIGERVFYHCPELATINIPSTVATLPSGVLCGCPKLTTLTLHEGITLLDWEALWNTGLETLTIPSTCTTFSYRTLSIPNLKTLYVNVKEPTNIRALDYYGQPQTMNSTVFGYEDQEGARAYLKNIDLIVPLGCAESYKVQAPWFNFRSITDQGSPYLKLNNSVFAAPEGSFTITNTENNGEPEFEYHDGWYEETYTHGLCLKEGTTVSFNTTGTSWVYVYLFSSNSNTVKLDGVEITNAEIGDDQSGTYSFRRYDRLVEGEGEHTITCNTYEGNQWPCMFLLRVQNVNGDYYQPENIGVNIDGISYVLKETVNEQNETIRTATIARQNPNLSGDIVIPEKVSYARTVLEDNKWVTLEAHDYEVTAMVVPGFEVDEMPGIHRTTDGAFQECAITSVSLPATLKSIPSGTFNGCQQLKSVTLAEGITTIGGGAFANCTSLEDIYLPETITEMSGWYVFGNCPSLKKVNIPKQVTSLGNGCFALSGIETFIIPENITSIGEVCFGKLYDWDEEYVNKLKSIKICHKSYTDGSFSFPDGIFKDIDGITLIVPEGTKESFYKQVYPWKDFENIIEYKDQKDEHLYNNYRVKYEEVADGDDDTPAEGRGRQKKTIPVNETVTASFTPSGVAPELPTEIEKDGKKYRVTFKEPLATVMPGEDLVLKVVLTPALVNGDANGDGEVNVSDIVEIVNDIMGKTSAKFVRDAADMNNDGEINVTDIVKVVSIIMSANNSARVKTALLENTDNDVLALTENNDGLLSLQLNNAGGYMASQFDVWLSGGTTLEGMILNNGRSSGHLLTYSEIGDNLYRVVIYSPENHPYVGNEGELLKIKTSGVGDVEIDNILFITESQAEKRFSPLRTSTTGIQTIEATSKSMDVYSLDGKLVSTDGNLQQLPKGVYIINKKKVIVK